MYRTNWWSSVHHVLGSRFDQSFQKEFWVLSTFTKAPWTLRFGFRERETKQDSTLE